MFGTSWKDSGPESWLPTLSCWCRIPHSTRGRTACIPEDPGHCHAAPPVASASLVSMLKMTMKCAGDNNQNHRVSEPGGTRDHLVYTFHFLDLARPRGLNISARSHSQSLPSPPFPCLSRAFPITYNQIASASSA